MINSGALYYYGNQAPLGDSSIQDNINPYIVNGGNITNGGVVVLSGGRYNDGAGPGSTLVVSGTDNGGIGFQNDGQVSLENSITLQLTNGTYRQNAALAAVTYSDASQNGVPVVNVIRPGAAQQFLATTGEIIFSGNPGNYSTLEIDSSNVSVYCIIQLRINGANHTQSDFFYVYNTVGPTFHWGDGQQKTADIQVRLDGTVTDYSGNWQVASANAGWNQVTPDPVVDPPAGFTKSFSKPVGQPWYVLIGPPPGGAPRKLAEQVAPAVLSPQQIADALFTEELPNLILWELHEQQILPEN